MSSTKSESEGGKEEVCASCGNAAVDDVKMKACNGGCDLVKYCSDNCQENNRNHHEQECKERKAELRDKQLFEQPGSSYYLGECPICFLPLSLDITKSRLMPCCSQFICIGCDYANLKREYEGGLQHRCSFCREPIPRSQKEADRYSKKRGKKNCPVALNDMAKERFSKGDNDKGLEYLTKAAYLGYANAHMCLATLPSFSTTTKRQQLGVNPTLDSILQILKRKMAGLKEQPNITSSLLTSDMTLRYKVLKICL